MAYTETRLQLDNRSHSQGNQSPPESLHKEESSQERLTETHTLKDNGAFENPLLESPLPIAGEACYPPTITAGSPLHFDLTTEALPFGLISITNLHVTKFLLVCRDTFLLLSISLTKSFVSLHVQHSLLRSLLPIYFCQLFWIRRTSCSWATNRHCNQHFAGEKNFFLVILKVSLQAEVTLLQHLNHFVNLWYREELIQVGLMGTIDLRAAADENSISDLSGQVHQLPCCIRFDGPAEVSHYFKPKSIEVEIDGVRMEEAHFRGRKLQGATISLPSGYSGFVLGQASNRNANGKRKTSSPTEDNPCWKVKAKFDNLTYWNHDNLPSTDDTFLRSFHMFSIAEALHKPVKVEDLVAVSHGVKDNI